MEAFFFVNHSEVNLASGISSFSDIGLLVVGTRDLWFRWSAFGHYQWLHLQIGGNSPSLQPEFLIKVICLFLSVKRTLFYNGVE